jgi:TonB family protein
MRKARRSFWPIGFVLLFASPLINFGQEANPRPSATPVAEALYKGKEVDKKVSIKKKPEPSYTNQARENGIEGTVIIRCIFTATGRVTNIKVISALPDGLAERAVEAAKKIKFIPATKDGHPVSMWMELQYEFHLQ